MDPCGDRMPSHRDDDGESRFLESEKMSVLTIKDQYNPDAQESTG